MLPPPPALFTTATVEVTSFFPSRMCSMARAVLSLLPPGTEPATISTFFCGDHACAWAATEAPASRPANRMRAAFMRFPPMLCGISFAHFDLLSDQFANIAAFHYVRQAVAVNTLELAKQLIARPSVTPNDAGCLDLLTALLEPLGFRCERFSANGVDNLWGR